MLRYLSFFFIISFLYQYNVYSNIISKNIIQKSTIPIGNLPNGMSLIGCGTWSWGNRFLWQYKSEDDDSIAETYNYVIRNGINWFDTADSYGTGDLAGQSELLLGKFGKLSDNLKLQSKIFYATKLAPFPWRIGQDSFIKANRESSQRLQRNVDIAQLHWPPSLGWQEYDYLNAFISLRKNQLIQQIGVSNYGPKSLTRISKYVQSKGCNIHTNQVQFSLLCRYPLETGLDKTCEELGIQPIAYSPLALGLLADKYTIDK